MAKIMKKMSKAQNGMPLRRGMGAIKGLKKLDSKMVPGEMTGKMYKKSEIDEIGRKQSAELDKSGVFGKAAMVKKKPMKSGGKIIKKKAQSGIEAALEAKTAERKAKGQSIIERQVKRLNRIAETNPDRSMRVAKRIVERKDAKKATVAPTMMKKGGMLKRADGSYSKRGLWDNIRANKGSGKKPTAAMLKQERKIKSKTK
jgi:hypothetical protein